MEEQLWTLDMRAMQAQVPFNFKPNPFCPQPHPLLSQMRGAEDEAAQVEEQLRALDTRAMQWPACFSILRLTNLLSSSLTPS